MNLKLIVDELTQDIHTIETHLGVDFDDPETLDYESVELALSKIIEGSKVDYSNLSDKEIYLLNTHYIFEDIRKEIFRFEKEYKKRLNLIRENIKSK